VQLIADQELILGSNPSQWLIFLTAAAGGNTVEISAPSVNILFSVGIERIIYSSKDTTEHLRNSKNL